MRCRGDSSGLAVRGGFELDGLQHPYWGVGGGHWFCAEPLYRSAAAESPHGRAGWAVCS
jgi:hypothetical protein